MLVVGLTGGIATGKSTVSKELKKHGWPIVDADLIAREVVEPNTRGYQQIIEAFGDVPDLVNPDKSLNRGALGQAVFGNKDRLRVLNGIVHPAVKKEIVKQLLQAYVSFHRVVVLDVPLLYELGLHRICGLVVTVSCDRTTQIERLKKRNPELGDDDVTKRIDSQLSNEARNFRADVVIDNLGPLDELKGAVEEVIERVEPLIVWTMLDYFPPFGLVSALVTVGYRSVLELYKGTSEKKTE